MPVTGVTMDPAARTMTLTAEWDAPPERAWRLWADPRRLERWWGPPDHPATVTEHDLRPGGRVAYVVTAPGGGTSRAGGTSRRSTRRTAWPSRSATRASRRSTWSSGWRRTPPGARR